MEVGAKKSARAELGRYSFHEQFSGFSRLVAACIAQLPAVLVDEKTMARPAAK